ncbi:glycoside hydrolase family 88/105 protein [Mucilaginibacter aquatilis]|uniref:Glycoside hydrolase family 88 protein n=1 Tax=Mucilaginibacter aquatilis TaxID=1517760 RepID=A0A6I4IQI2_9SPHI|nr:glycoside hydrolase family 88 protein [Mucilaginibacter aquatilis]MVN91753.1 glycoside hydrolase family 88 protein [Mucilaginibacter aquatilis]
MKFSKTGLILTLFTVTGLQAFSQKTTSGKSKAEQVVKDMQRVADWQINKWNTDGYKYPKVDWTLGACYTGIFALGNLPGNERYLDVLIKIGEDNKWNTGKRRFYADDYCVAQTYSQLYLRYKEPKMIAPFRALADSIAAQPHTEPLNWKNNIAMREWAWCDALFMGPPALSYLTLATGDQKYTNTAIKLWWKTTEFLYDPAEKLYFRDETYLNKKEQNGQKVFWSRGNGWVLAGLVRLLEGTPAKHPDRKKLEKLYKDMAGRIVSLQQPDGSWHASLLDPASYPIKEMSGTGFYCYALAWGVNHGLLNKKAYWPAVEKAWAALTSSVHENGMLGYVQPIGASPDKVDASSTEVYGVGAFLLSGSEIYKYNTK